VYSERLWVRGGQHTVTDAVGRKEQGRAGVSKGKDRPGNSTEGYCIVKRKNKRGDEGQNKKRRGGDKCLRTKWKPGKPGRTENGGAKKEGKRKIIRGKNCPS